MGMGMGMGNGGGDGSGGTHVYLNVYDLTPVNNYLYWFGLGVFHSGIEVHGMEYGFGAHDYPTSGVFENSAYLLKMWLENIMVTCII